MRYVRLVFVGIVCALWLSGCGGGKAEPPVAVDDTATTTANTAVAIDVTANDIPADDTIDPSTVEIVSGPNHGSAVVGGVVIYTPDPGFVGTDTFTYTYLLDRDDEVDTSNLATVTVTVTAGTDFVNLVQIVLSAEANSEPVELNDLTFADQFAAGDPEPVDVFLP